MAPDMYDYDTDSDDDEFALQGTSADDLIPPWDPKDRATSSSTSSQNTPPSLDPGISHPWSRTRFENDEMDEIRGELSVMNVLRDQLIAQEQRITDLTSQIHTLESEQLLSHDNHHTMRLLRDRVAQLEGALRKAENDLKFTQRRSFDESALTTSLQAEVESFSRAVGAARDEASQYRQESNDLKLQLAAAHNDAERTREANSELKLQLREVELRSRTDRNDTLHHHHEVAIQANDLSAQLAELQAKMSVHSGEMNAKAGAIKEWRLQCDRLSSAVNERDAEVGKGG